jgi:hypothetical protein
MSVNGSALESLYNAVSEGRGHILEEVRASNTRAEMHVVIDPALQSQQTMAGTSSMDDRVVNWNITFLDRTGPSTGVIHLATVSPCQSFFRELLGSCLLTWPQFPKTLKAGFMRLHNHYAFPSCSPYDLLLQCADLYWVHLTVGVNCGMMIMVAASCGGAICSLCTVRW